MISTKEELSHIKSRQFFEYTCINCGLVVKVKYYKPHMFKRYSTFLCEHCQREYTNLDKFGVTYPLKDNRCVIKSKMVKKERYGDENYSNLEQTRRTKKELYGNEFWNNPEKISETLNSKSEEEIESIVCKRKKTKKDRYDDENYVNITKAKATKKEIYGDENFTNQSKRKETKKERYGNEYFTNRPKAKQTNFERNGDEFWNNPEKISTTYNSKSYEEKQLIIEKSKNSKKEIYGDETFSNPDKAIRTRRERYGKIHVEHSYFYDGLYFDGSWELYYWISRKDAGANIETKTKLLEYVDPIDGKTRLYEVDFVDNGELVEIKGPQFFKNNDPNSGEMINPFDHSQDERYNAKFKCMLENNVNIVSKNEIEPHIKYVNDTYGVNYIDLFKMYGQFCMTMFSFYNNTGLTPFDVNTSEEYQYLPGEGVTPFSI